eukprot:bmy_12368T0
MLYDYSFMYLSIDEAHNTFIQLTSSQLRYNPKKNNKLNTGPIDKHSTGLIAQKTRPNECGFDPIGSARLPFSIKFFLVAITFLLFDLEIPLLVPLP